MKIAIAQLNPTVGDLTGNAQAILTAAQHAAEAGATLLVTTELALCGYPPRDLLMRPDFLTATKDTLQQLAQDAPPQLALLVGTVTVNPEASTSGGKPLFNSAALLHHGTIQQVFHKQLLPTYDVFDEDRYFEPDTRPNVLTLPNSAVKLGITICEDLWNDAAFWGKRTYRHDPIATLAQEKVQLTLNLSASPFSVGKLRLREDMLRHLATRYDQPILYVNQVGGNDDLIFDGGSLALNRQGEVVARGRSFATDFWLVEYDPASQDLRPVAATTLAPPPANENAEIWSALVLGVRDYARKCGFSQAVIGLSGGIDSSLVAAIAAEALGPTNVLGVLMPSPYSSAHSLSDAAQLATNLGIHTTTLPIGEAMASYDRTLAELFRNTEFGVTEENIQSRIRGNLLMAIANKFGHLLLSTGNKSEMAVGYCTLYGDMNGGLAVIADVPKTRVYAICDWLNTDTPGHQFAHLAAGDRIPPNVITKPPSAELKPGQTDQDSLPPYDELDDILTRLIQGHQSQSEIVAAGHAPQVVQRIIQLVTRAEFKRRQAPPVLKVTDRAFGVGWRMPIAQRWQPKT